MRRWMLAAIAVAIVGSLVGGSAAAQLEIPGYVVSDLQLISQESKEEWSEDWTGPIQGATILAWLAEHGYPALIRDFNGDGVIDELDTIELADLLGREYMDTTTPRGTTDVRLVLGLARYVAETYPNRFVLKIYDVGFAAEYAADEGMRFEPDAVDGIELVLKADPTIPTYELELTSGEGVIVGLEEEADRNTYLSGRSFLDDETAEGFTPIDLAWAEEDYWEPGLQGQVLETVAKMEDRLYAEFRGMWTPVEFMLALSPTEEHDVTSAPHECVDVAIGYDLTTTDLGDYGSVQVEECVTREGDVDTYTYTVTNVDFLFNGCGLCLFAVSKPIGLVTLAHSEPAPWLYSLYPTGWVWRLPTGSCGLLPGESAVFSVSVPGPTTDTWVIGLVSSCPTISVDGVYHPAELVPIKTTGPGMSHTEPGCPDLIVRYLDESCVCDPSAGMCQLTVWVNIHNIGSAPVTGSFDVVLMSPGHPGTDTKTYTPPPALTPGDFWTVKLDLSFPMEGDLCPAFYRVIVDPDPAPNGVIAECDEGNNALVREVDCFCDELEERGACCFPDGSCIEMLASDCSAAGGIEFHPGIPCGGIDCAPPVETCPDLVCEIGQMSCRNIGAVAPLWEVSVEVIVTNVGSATVDDPIYVGASLDCGSDSTVLFDTLDPGDVTTANFIFTCGPNQPGCHDVTAVVDDPDFIDECDEDNNESDSATVCCR